MPILPPYARIDRSLPPGEHAFSILVPGIAESPALRRIEPDASARRRLLARARVLICGPKGYAFVDVENRRIVISEEYYTRGDALDLYLDLLHELTHLRQLDQGFDLWDDRFEYVDRPTEVEAYSVAVHEGRRLGMSDDAIRAHLTNPWMNAADVAGLLVHVNRFLATGMLPNLVRALFGAPFVSQQPWRCPKPAPRASTRLTRQRLA